MQDINRINRRAEAFQKGGVFIQMGGSKAEYGDNPEDALDAIEGVVGVFQFKVKQTYGIEAEGDCHGGKAK